MASMIAFLLYTSVQWTVQTPPVLPLNNILFTVSFIWPRILGDMGLFPYRPTTLLLAFLLDLLHLYISIPVRLLVLGVECFSCLLCFSIDFMLYSTFLYFSEYSLLFSFYRRPFVLLLCNDIIVLVNPIDLLLWSLVRH